MSRFQVRAASLVVIVLAAGALTAATDAPASRRDADQMKAKIATIEQRAGGGGRQAQQTTVTQSELNSFLALDGRALLPAGVSEPVITMDGSGHLTGHAIVDLDAIRRQKNPTSMLDPSNLLMGRLPVTAAGVLHTSEGVGRFDLESASIGGMPVPKAMLQQVLSYYSCTPEHPGGISIDDPFQLPARIQTIGVEPGRAIIVQQ